jgi:hypothetical protein
LAELNSVEQYFLERTSEANYGLWNALLTINGILVSALTLLITIHNLICKVIIKIAVVSCVISIILIICNYLIRKKQLLEIGRCISSQNLIISNEKKKEDIERSIRRHKITLWIEKIALILLAFEILLVVIMVFGF